VSDQTGSGDAESGPEHEGIIEVRVTHVAQLFNSLDPSPFIERDLDDDAEQYILGWAREIEPQLPLRILVHVPEREAAGAEARSLPEAVANYFAYRAGMIERDIHELLRVGRRSLATGLVVLGVSIVLGQVARRYLLPEQLGQLVAEGLTLFGWVANWRPAEIFLYDWRVERNKLALYRRLAGARVDVLAR
jgi:hypothetical protein